MTEDQHGREARIIADLALHASEECFGVAMAHVRRAGKVLPGQADNHLALVTIEQFVVRTLLYVAAQRRHDVAPELIIGLLLDTLVRHLRVMMTNPAVLAALHRIEEEAGVTAARASRSSPPHTAPAGGGGGSDAAVSPAHGG